VISNGGSGHPGGSLSATDLLTALYFAVLRQKPSEPTWPQRDRFVLSKGHACPALYVILAELGYFPRAELQGFRKINRMLQGHPEYGIPGIEVPTGSLGQGFSSSVGIALGLKMQSKAQRVYVLVGDGESQEGQVWEAAMAAAHYRLSNMTALVDYNRMQQDGFLEDIRRMEPFAQKWRAFGWETREIDGHNIEEILEALEWAARIEKSPQAIIARTIKGKGISFMENVPKWHGTQPPSEQELAAALEELRARERKLAHG
jgi:transketolase